MNEFLQVMILIITAGIGTTLFFFRKGGIYNPSDKIDPVIKEISDFTNLPYMPVEAPILPPEASKPPLLWDTPRNAYKSTRVLCDEAGLAFTQKEIVCACIFQESEFNNKAVGRNKDPKTGKVWSTDWGIVQVNDTKGWHIGNGLRFSSVEDVLANPGKAVRWMISVMKTTGKLQPWASYTTKAYIKHLSPTSRMMQLKML